MMVRTYLVLLVMVCGPAQAELNSLFALGRSPTEAEVVTPAVARGGLFDMRGDQGMFAPLPERDIPAPAPPVPSILGTGNAPLDRLLSLIAQAEAGSAGYNAVQYGARIKPAFPPTQMTLGEIYEWIDDTPGQPHAIGRYQFIPDTLRRVAQERGFGPETQFSAGVQDALALVLLEDAGYARFQAGELDRRRFMYNLSRIWAGLPLPNRKSYYDGYAGNSATMSWASFNSGMARIWPAGG